MTSPPAMAQTRPAGQLAPPASLDPDVDTSEEVVVVGQRPRGAVIRDVAPEEQYNAGDVRALGVSSIDDLVTELGPQLESASGRPPVILLEGHRISNFSEIRSLPAEAIARVDILPEEVGLRYGYSADQKVMNIVLRQRFRAATGELTGKVPTQGGGKSVKNELGFLSIRKGARFNLSSDVSSQARLLESERGLTGSDADTRTLSPFDTQMTLNASHHRPLGERLAATINGVLTTDKTISDIGPAFSSVLIPAGSPYATGASDSSFTPYAAGIGPLERSASAQTGHVGFSLDRDQSGGQMTLTGNYDHGFTRSISDRPFNLAAYAAAVAAGDPLADPAQPLDPQFAVARPADLNRSISDSGTLDLLYSTRLARMPSGDLALTAHVAGASQTYRTSATRNALPSDSRIHRDDASGSLNLTVPIAGFDTPLARAIGQLSIHGDASVDRLSDAGTLRGFGTGFNWVPRKGISLSGNFSDKQTAPTPQQLGDPSVVTQTVPVFDYVTGQSVLATTISGGNGALDKAESRNYRLGLSIAAKNDPRLNFTLDLTHSRTTNGIAALPGITSQTQDAFPDRFTRDLDGMLTQVDLRPVNIAEQQQTKLRWGFNFTKQLKTPKREVDAMREAFARRFANRRPAGATAEPAPLSQPATTTGQGGSPGQSVASAAGEGGAASQSPPPGGPERSGAGASPGGRGRRFGGPGRFGGANGFRGGRLNFAVYHSWVLSSTARLAPGLPEIDLLNGGTLGGGAGPSRHQIDVQAGFSQSGLGVRMFGKWQSAADSDGVSGFPTTNLRFSSLATLNLRLFATFNQRPRLVEKFPLLRGARLAVSVNNLFDSRQHVTDGTGATPLAYESAYLNPVGRTVSISIRKLFF